MIRRICACVLESTLPIAARRRHRVGFGATVRGKLEFEVLAAIVDLIVETGERELVGHDVHAWVTPHADHS
jgi:hypothetical protein